MDVARWISVLVIGGWLVGLAGLRYAGRSAREPWPDGLLYWVRAGRSAKGSVAAEGGGDSGEGFGDVPKVTVHFWNRSGTAIHAHDVVTPVRIELPPHCRGVVVDCSDGSEHTDRGVRLVDVLPMEAGSRREYTFRYTMVAARPHAFSVTGGIKRVPMVRVGESEGWPGMAFSTLGLAFVSVAVCLSVGVLADSAAVRTMTKGWWVDNGVAHGALVVTAMIVGLFGSLALSDAALRSLGPFRHRPHEVTSPSR